MAAEETRRLRTIEDVARICSISRQTVRRAIEKGDLRATRLGPHTVRIDEDDMNDWIERGRRGR